MLGYDVNCFFLSLTNVSTHSWNEARTHRDECTSCLRPKTIFRNTIWTAKGNVTYAEVEENVFRPNNYRIVEPSFPLPKLDFISKQSCSQVTPRTIEVQLMQLSYPDFLIMFRFLKTGSLLQEDLFLSILPRELKNPIKVLSC